MIVAERYASGDGRDRIERWLSRPGGQRGHMVTFRDGEIVSRGTGFGKAAVAREARRAGLVEVVVGEGGA